MEFSRGILSDYIDFNPRENLSKGSPTKEVAMADLMPFQKKISSYCVSPYRGGMKFRNGDTLLARITPCLENGKTAFVDILSEDEVGFGSTEYIVLRALPQKMVPEFVFYFVTSDWFRKRAIALMTGSSGRQRVQTDKLMNLEVTMPDLETQKKIVKILSVLDKKIDFINCENCIIENILQNYFNNWIDNIKPIATVGLDEIAKYTNGLAMQKFRPVDNDLGLPVVKIKEMNSGISKDTARCTSELKEEYKVFPGDVLFAWSGTLCVKIWDGEVAGLNQHIFKVTSEEYPKWFYYFWIKKHLERFINIAKGKATTMGHIQRKELSLSEVLIPNEHELKEQDELFRPLLEKIVCNNSQRESLLHLRDTLLPKLMTNKIDLGNVNL